MAELPRYEPAAVEARWQARWRQVESPPRPAAPGGRGVYLLSISPSPAGQLHMRQVRLYTFADTWARYRRARGDDVLFSIGFDSFTLFVERAAIRGGVEPRKLAARAQAQVRAQLERLGCSFDWSRSFHTSDEPIYRWSQWLFLKLLERGLVYQASAPIDWCDRCEVALAASLVLDGGCWRCGRAARRLERPQWFLRMEPYLAELYAGVEDLTGWEVEQTRQRSLFGRSDGVELELHTADGRALTAFTPHPSAVGAAAFVALAPDHPGIRAWCSAAVRGAVEAAAAAAASSPERRAAQVPVIRTGLQVVAAGLARALPVVVSAIVSHRFGGGAALGIPAVDAADAELARRLGLEVPSPLPAPPELSVRPAVRYRIQDHAISRQRSWGTPIPVVHCPGCGVVPVPASELPVVLPRDLRPVERGNPLATHPEFASCSCPRCGAAARRESDTLDGQLDGLWSWIVPCVPPADRASSVFDHAELARWLPVAQVFWTERRSAGLLDIRFLARVMRDLGLLPHVPGGEPFRDVLVTGVLQLDERKAPPGLEDVADPAALIRRFGADVLRLSLLHAASPRKDATWTGASLVECSRFLRDVWDFVVARRSDLGPREPRAAGAAPPDRACRRLLGWRETALAKITANLEAKDFHAAARNAMTLFERIRQFDAAARSRHATLPDPARRALQEAVVTLLRALAPMTPHVAAELWERCGGGPTLASQRWPSPTDPPAFSLEPAAPS